MHSQGENHRSCVMVGDGSHVAVGVDRFLIFFSGVSQRTLSTPGVLLPWFFSHSSFTARAFAAIRVGQQTLQGFHLALSSFLRCLHNTRLEPPHVSVYLYQGIGMPLTYSLEDAPACVSTTVICLFLPGVVCQVLLC